MFEITVISYSSSIRQLRRKRQNVDFKLLDLGFIKMESSERSLLFSRVQALLNSSLKTSPKFWNLRILRAWSNSQKLSGSTNFSKDREICRLAAFHRNPWILNLPRFLKSWKK